MKIKGRVWKFGDDINTDVIIPSRYLRTFDSSVWPQHVMEGVDPEFPRKVKPGDIIVAGKNFGCGSSREQAAIALKLAGVAAVVAESFGWIFFRNAINNGLPAIECPGISKAVETGDIIEVDLKRGLVATPRGAFKVKPYPPFMRDILAYGGLVEYFKRKIKSA